MDISDDIRYNIDNAAKGVLLMKRWLILALVALIALCPPAVAEQGPEDVETEFGFEFMDDGYTGEWTKINALGFEFCLPEGWGEIEAPAEAVFAAVQEGGAAALSIRAVAEDVEDLSAWSAENLPLSQGAEAGFYDVRVFEEGQALAVYLLVADGRLIAFDFTRGDEQALPRDFALQIVGSVCEIWDDEDVPLPEGDADGFDFGEAFEADLN